MDHSDDGESVVADSDESDRTPSPSILGGLELLDRRRVITDVKNATSGEKQNSLISQQNETASGMHKDDEQKWRDFDSRTVSEMERSYSPAARYPFFKKVENYHHSPVFTPPRKLFRPADSKSGDKIETAFLQVPSTMELPVGTEAMDVCSQVLFSGSQESSMSQCLSVRHRECPKSMQGDQNKDEDKVLPNSSCSTSDMLHQSINCEENLFELAKPLESGKKCDRPVVTQSALSPAPGNMYQPSRLDTKVKEGSHLAEQQSSSQGRPSHHIAVDSSQVEKVEDEGNLPASKVSLQSCEKGERSTSLLPDSSKSACTDVSVTSRLITSRPASSSQLTPDPAKMLHSSKQDDSASLERLEEEYKMLCALVEDGGKSLAALKQNLKKLQQALKDKAQKIQLQRGHLMSCDSGKMSESQQQLQKQELFNLSKKQKHLLYILNIHKRASSNLTIKEMQAHGLESDVTDHERNTLQSDETNAKEVCQTPSKEKTPGGNDQGPSVVRTKEERPVDPIALISSKDGTDHNNATQEMDSQSASQLSQNATITMPMPQLAVKDLIENGFLKPSKGCMSFVYEGHQISADLQPDGSVRSRDVLYKTEKEWFISVCGQPASSIRKPKLWSLIKYYSTPLKAFADQCQLLSLAKNIEVPKTAMTKVTVSSRQNIKADSPRSLKPRVNISSSTQEKKLQSRGHFDPSIIKSVVLIGNNELFSEDNLLTNGFWENTKAEGSLIPLQWLKEINSWED